MGNWDCNQVSMVPTEAWLDDTLVNLGDTLANSGDTLAKLYCIWTIQTFEDPWGCTLATWGGTLVTSVDSQTVG